MNTNALPQVMYHSRGLPLPQIIYLLNAFAASDTATFNLCPVHQNSSQSIRYPSYLYFHVTHTVLTWLSMLSLHLFMTSVHSQVLTLKVCPKVWSFWTWWLTWFSSIKVKFLPHLVLQRSSSGRWGGLQVLLLAGDSMQWVRSCHLVYKLPTDVCMRYLGVMRTLISYIWRNYEEIPHLQLWGKLCITASN